MQAIMEQEMWRDVLKSSFLKKSKQADKQSTVFFGDGIDPDKKLDAGMCIESFTKSSRDNDYVMADLANLMKHVYVVVVEFEGGKATSYILDPNHDSIGMRQQQRGIAFTWDGHVWGRWDNYLAYGLIGLIKDSGDAPEKVRQIAVWDGGTPKEVVDGWAECAPDENIG